MGGEGKEGKEDLCYTFNSKDEKEKKMNTNIYKWVCDHLTSFDHRGYQC